MRSFLTKIAITWPKNLAPKHISPQECIRVETADHRICTADRLGLWWHLQSCKSYLDLVTLITYPGQLRVLSPGPELHCQAGQRRWADTPEAPDQGNIVSLSQQKLLSPCEKLTPSLRSCHSDWQIAGCWAKLKWERCNETRK